MRTFIFAFLGDSRTLQGYVSHRRAKRLVQKCPTNVVVVPDAPVKEPQYYHIFKPRDWRSNAVKIDTRRHSDDSLLEPLVKGR